MMVRGCPVCHMPMLLSCHPPTILPNTPELFRKGFPGPKGSSYTAFMVTLLRTSKTLGPLSQLRQFTFSGPFDSPPPTDPSLMEWDRGYRPGSDMPFVNRSPR